MKDTDRDGLLNIWESPQAAGLLDPADNQPIPDLYVMRARDNIQDIFLEVGFMTAAAPTRYGPLTNSQCIAPACEEDLDGHSHLPLKSALDLVAWGFRRAYGTQNAPRAGGQFGPINIHFDVGANHQPASQPSDNTCLSTNNNNWDPNCAIIPASLARGGEAINESTFIPLEFSDHPGTVGWKFGYRLLRDQPKNLTEQVCLITPSCERRFDRNRRYMFRYALFAHALAVAIAPVDDPNTPINEAHTPVKDVRHRRSAGRRHVGHARSMGRLHGLGLPAGFNAHARIRAHGAAAAWWQPRSAKL